MRLLPPRPARILRATLFIGLISQAMAQENLFRQVPGKTHPQDNSEVEAKALFSMPAPGGFLPVRVTVINQRKSDASLRFTTSSTSGSGNNGSQLDSRFAIESKAGATSIHDLLVPLTTRLDSGYGFSGTSISVGLSGSLGSADGSLNSNFADDAPAVLMSEKLHTPNASALDAQLNTTPGSSSYGSVVFSAKFEPSEMPEDWRAYSGYDVLILTDEDWGRVAPGARNAILQWCRLGGRLDVLALSPSTSLKSLGIPDSTATRSDHGFGSLSLERIDSLTLDAPAIIGRYLDPSTVETYLNRSIRHDFSSWPLHDSFGSQAFNYAIFIIVLIAFGILVGPVNLFVFAKSGQRHRLFITTPIISLATSALLVGLILLKDGLGGRGARVSLIEVRPDSGENAAYVLQEQISRTGVLVGSSFTVGESAAITPVPIAASPWARLTAGNGGGGMRYDAVFGDGKLSVTGDWFQSRSEQGQLVRAVVPTRGRVEIRGDAGPPVLLSSFEFPIDVLYYKDRSNGHWLARDLKPGVSATGTSITEAEYQTAIGQHAGLLSERHKRFLDKAAARGDHFVALATRAPAIETFAAIRWQDNRTLLTGPVAR